MANISLASALGVANGEPVIPLPKGSGQPCSAFQLHMFDDGAFEAHMEISPDDGTTWTNYDPTTAKIATGMIEAVFIGEGVAVRLVNASGTVSAVLIPLP